MLECGCIQPVPVELDTVLSSLLSDDDGNRIGAEGDGEDNKTNEKMKVTSIMTARRRIIVHGKMSSRPLEKK